MANSKEAGAIVPSKYDSQLSSAVFDLSQQVQGVMEEMLKMITEIDEGSAVINEDLEKCTDFVVEKRKGLEEEKENFQKAAYAVLDMLNNSNT